MRQSYKYLNKKERKGRTIWIINPSPAARDALDIGYEQYDTFADGRERSKEITEAFERHLLQQTTHNKMHIPKNTVDALFHWWKQHKSYRGLALNSKRTYDQVYHSICDIRVGESKIRFGSMLIKHVDAKVADRLHSTITKSISKHRADAAAKVLRRMFYVARRGLLRSNHANPFSQMGLSKLESRRVLWEDSQVQLFINTADKLGVSSVGTLALLCFHLCQRPGDMRQLTWLQFNCDAIQFIQEKTKKYNTHPMTLGLTPQLIERLSALERGEDDDVILTYEATGLPYDQWMYAKVARRVRKAAGLPSDLQIRDLRRSGATEMGEAGATEDQIAAVTGHKSREMLNIYVNPTRKIAQAGMELRFANKSG